MFSFYLANSGSGGVSFIDFGTPNEAITRGQTTVWLKTQDEFWTSSITGMFFSDQPNSLFRTKTVKARTSTSSAYLRGPKSEIKFIKEKLGFALNDDYKENERGMIIDCDDKDKLPKLYLAFGDKWFVVRPKDYVIPDEGGELGKCVIAIDQNTSDDYWVLGHSFIKGWYIIHDYANQKQGFIPIVEADGQTKSTPVDANLPTKDDDTY